MNERQADELALLRTRYPLLEFVEDGLWVRIPGYPVPGSLWTKRKVDVVGQIPNGAGVEPYGFYVPKELSLRSGETIQSHTDGVTPFPGAWGKFSWAITWQPAADIHAGTNMSHFVASFADRFRQGA